MASEGNHEERAAQAAARYDSELRILEEDALRLYDTAVEASEGAYHSIRGLAQHGFLNVDEYVEAWSLAHYKRNERAADEEAYWVGQREVAFLGEDEIGRGERIGTDNLQQCVAIIIDGTGLDDKRKVVVAHIDKYTTPESVQEALHEFNMGPGTQIQLYGGRSEQQREISEANIAIAESIIAPAIAKGAVVDSSRLRDPNSSPNIVYDPRSKVIKEGVLPIKGHSTQEIRLMSRRAQNAHMTHDFDDRAVPARDSPIRAINLAHPERGGLSDIERCTLLKNFATRACTQSLEDLNRLTDVRNPRQLSEYCAMELKPLGDGVKHALSVSAGYEIRKSHIFKGSPRVLALCNEVGSRGPQPPHQGAKRRLVPDAPGENIPITHKVADEMRRRMSARDDGGRHAQAQALGNNAGRTREDFQ